ncbi:hypothetical protein ACHAWO_000665 [Cyclotella atomus]|uniref:Telomeric single stranded DNA binding POT1/Cdc13 domain-containing protein n=1 Tax=Cyclotella atomus TaxID=382360 RepID=A0ABD3QAR0_9STRA
MSFLLNLFSPRKQAAAESEAAEDAAEKLEKEMMSDPLSNFFGAATCDKAFAGNAPVASDELAPDNDLNVLYSQWKSSRKEFLMNYLEHRLVGVDEQDENRHEDCCSFCSEVLDEDFDASEGNADSSQDVYTSESQDANNSSGTQELETQDTKQPNSESKSAASDDYMLETQPQTQLPTPRFFNTPRGDQSGTQSTKGSNKGKSTDKSIDTAELVNRSMARGFISGIKRKLGFRDDTETQEHTTFQFLSKTPNSAETPSSSQPRKKRRRTSPKHNRTDYSKRRGLPPKTIPHISDTSYSATKLSDLDLQTKNLDLDLSRVLRVWRLRSCKRIAPVNIGGSQSQESTQNFANPVESGASMHMTSFGRYEDDGPLNTVYKNVLSIEVAQLRRQANPTPSSPSVSNLASAAFQSGQAQLRKVAERKRRHEVKRVRIFFYNKYAEVLSRLLDDISSKGDKKKKKSNCLLSLNHVPAHCIIPLQMAQVDPLLEQYVNNSFCDEDYGATSSYCVCIGDTCSLKFGGEKLYFDDGRLELRLTEIPTAAEPCIETEEAMDAIVNAVTVRAGGEGYYWEAENSTLIKRYWNYKGWEQPQKKGGMTILVGDGTAAVNGSTKAQSHDGEAQNLRESAGERSGETQEESDHITRPASVKQLAELHPLLDGEKRLRPTVTVYGVVLGFSPPSLTSTKEWKMSMVLIDESLPISTESHNQDQTGNGKKELHVPSITVILFSKNKLHLPVIRSAGDVICCRNAILQLYNDEPQLLCNRKANLIVVRPTTIRSPGVELHNSTLSSDWSLSCNCHDAGEHDSHPYVNWSLANSLWRWGQRRLSSHPTMSPSCTISISGLDKPVENVEVTVAGDLTAVVASIIPCPEHLRRRDTARGYIRLWDGTGPPRSDPLPPDVDAIAYRAVEDPPEKVLTEIERVIKTSSLTESQNQFDGMAAPIALTGRVINATIWEEELWQLIQKEKIVEVGSFVRLRNVNSSRLPSGTQILSVHSKSSLTPLPSNVYEIKHLLKDHDTRIKQGVAYNPQSGILPGKSLPKTNTTSTNQPQLPMLKEFKSQAAPTTFTNQFYISRTIPPFNPYSSHAMQRLCHKNKDGSFGFRFAFHIFDDSTELDVLCLGAAADKLIGFKAQDVMSSMNTEKQAVETLNDILTPGNLFEGEIHSVLGKDKKVYYILKSMNCLHSNA